MSEYQGFLPEEIPGWQMPFWDSLKAHNVNVQKCADCGLLRHVPKEICPNCQSRFATWSPISGDGEIYTYTVVRRAPTSAYQEEAPYVIAHVTMAEGFRMIGTVVDIEPETVRIGMPVTVTYDDVTPEWTLLKFKQR